MPTKKSLDSLAYPAPREVVWENGYSVVAPQINAEGVHVWTFDPLLPVDVRYFVFGRNISFRQNRHDYFELLLILSGRFNMQVQDSDFTLHEGDLFLINSTLYHRGFERDQRAKGVVLYFLPEAIRSEETAQEGTQYLVPFLIQDGSYPPVVRAESGLSSEILQWLKRIHAHLPANTPLARLTVKTFLKIVLVLLARHFQSDERTKEICHRRSRWLNRLQPLFKFIDQHYNRPITTSDAARRLCMSESHFMRFFRGATGQSFLSYLNQCRIAKAQSLMASTEKPLSDIALEVGFCDQSYFGSVFRKAVAMTPREYKQYLRAEDLSNTKATGT